MKILKTLVLVAVAAVGSLNASVLTGDTVNITYYYPNLTSAVESIGTFAVPGTSSSYFGVFTMDVADNSLTANFTDTTSWVAPVPFNGFVLTDETNSPFTGVTVDPATNMAGFTATNVSFTPNQILVDWQGLSFDTSTVVKLDINASATPEPGFAWCALLIAGCFGAVKWYRSSKRSATA